MKDYQQRVVDEKTNLDEKRAKLDAFMKSPGFQAVAEDERARLVMQAEFMRGYSDVLGQRIEEFK